MSISITVVILILIGSLGLLIFSSQKTINLVEALMEVTRLNESAAGFIILAMMSSLSELIVAIFSIVDGEPSISIGDIFGSHIFNIAFIIGLLSVLGFCKKCHSIELGEINDVLFLASILPLLLLFSHFQAYNIAGSPVIGAILIIVYFSSLFFITKKREKEMHEHPKENPTFICINGSDAIQKSDSSIINEEKMLVNTQESESNIQNKEMPKNKKWIFIILLKILFFAGLVILAGRLIIMAVIIY